jgi:hypothetical protein
MFYLAPVAAKPTNRVIVLTLLERSMIPTDEGSVTTSTHQLKLAVVITITECQLKPVDPLSP